MSHLKNAMQNAIDNSAKFDPKRTASDTRGSHGVIVKRDGSVFYQFGHHGERQGSMPLQSGHAPFTAEEAIAAILRIFQNYGVASHEVIDG